MSKRMGVLRLFLCSFGADFPFFLRTNRGTIPTKWNLRKELRFFFKKQEEYAALIRLYGRKENPADGPREGVVAMKKRAVCLGMLLLMLCGSQAMAQSAVVNNGSDPSSRLNMREQPSRDADSVGQFYTGTPVEIVSDAGGGWSEVTVGGGSNSLSGYMMSRYLSTDASSVQEATKEMQVVSPYGTQSVVVRDTPSNSYDAVTMLEVGDEVRVIGTKGNYYYVLLDDNSVGCLSTSEAN